ncbi:MAG: hypothetical protein QOC96_709 [Acidobacteriota bacterium]|nr:hypothetical protein [Acidobacteriota bacterium]
MLSSHLLAQDTQVVAEEESVFPVVLYVVLCSGDVIEVAPPRRVYHRQSADYLRRTLRHYIIAPHIERRELVQPQLLKCAQV